MGNCLVTKLKGIVNNDNLPKLNVMSFYITQAASIPSGQEANTQSMILNLVSPAKLTVVGDGGCVGASLSDLGNNKQHMNLVAGDNTVWFKNATFKAEFDNKFAIKEIKITLTMSTISIIKFNIDELKYSETLTMVRHNGNIGGDVSNLPLSCAYLDLYNSNLAGDLDSLSGRNIKSTSASMRFVACPNLTGSIFTMSNATEFQVLYSNNIGGNLSDLVGKSVTSIDMPKTRLTGSMTSAGGITTLATLKAQNCALDGSIEEFVAVRRQAGQTTGSMSVILSGTDVTFNGGKNHTTSATDITWTASTITYNGTTINA